MHSLVKGANTVIAPIAELPAFVVDVTWEAGGLDCDVITIVCGPDRKVLDDEHFVFYNQPVTPERSVFLLTGGRIDHSQVAVDTTALSPMADRFVVSLATIADGATLGQVRRLRVALVDPTGRGVIAEYVVSEVTSETCLILCEVYRHGTSWKMRAVGQGYTTGLRGLGRDYGVDV